MKKLMIAAMMLLGTSAAFAGDSEPLKAILKAKTYAEAEQLVKSNLSQLANDAEKAKAYNKLVELALDKVSKEQGTITSNQVAKQYGQGKEEAYDTIGFYNALYNAMKNAIECNVYDQKPDAKGKIKPKFESKNAQRLYAMRLNLINGGQAASQADNKLMALQQYGMYVDSAFDPLFKSIDKTKTPDQYLGEVARVAGVYAFQNKNLDLANKYVDVALQDTATFKEALNLKVYLMSQNLKNNADSVAYAGQLKDLYAKYPNNSQIFATLAGLYSSLKQTEAFDKLISEKLAVDPKYAIAWELKGQQEMNANKIDDAVKSFTAAVETDGENVVVLTYLGFCLNAKAGNLQDPNGRKVVYNEAIKYLEKAKSLDPNREKANWSYPLYSAYYGVYGANDARTKEMEDLNK
ncbi:MAG: hypothetical protein IJS06_03000 [Prevotella sp.]|nr:hypothetical protein [Prevotella sp.]